MHRFAVGIVTFVPSRGPTFCSGLLLAPTLVATARHCVSTIASLSVDCASSRFGAAVDPATVYVTPDALIDTPAGTFAAVERVVVPTDAGDDAVCGDDLALLVLASPIALLQYVTPTVDPPMTDARYSKRITAIGYGVTSPTDSDGSSARIRRIKQEVPLACIPNDPSFVDCLASPSTSALVSPREFIGGDATTCAGDSGSGAFDQGSFDAGRWVAFGVLSRGAVSADGQTCVQPIYTRFDAWGPLLVATARDAAAQAGYEPPDWTAPAATADAAPELVAGPSSAGGCTTVQRSERDTRRGGPAWYVALALLALARRRRVGARSVAG